MENETPLSNQRELEEIVPKILIVEDDLTYQPFWESVIKPVNAKAVIDWVTSEELAEQLLLEEYRRGHPYDLVILDIFLSGRGTGIDLWNRFKEAGKNFIFISQMERQRYEAFLNDQDAYPLCLEKPLNAGKCRQIVETMLKKVEPSVQ